MKVTVKKLKEEMMKKNKMKTNNIKRWIDPDTYILNGKKYKVDIYGKITEVKDVAIQ